MLMPVDVRVGSCIYKVVLTEEPLVINGQSCLGYCDYMNHIIKINTTLQDEQAMEQTLLHEIAHAMFYERQVDLCKYMSNDEMEYIIDSIGFMLHQLILDNPSIFVTEQMLKDAEVEIVETKE